MKLGESAHYIDPDTHREFAALVTETGLSGGRVRLEVFVPDGPNLKGTAALDARLGGGHYHPEDWRHGEIPRPAPSLGRLINSARHTFKDL